MSDFSDIKLRQRLLLICQIEFWVLKLWAKHVNACCNCSHWIDGYANMLTVKFISASSRRVWVLIVINYICSIEEVAKNTNKPFGSTLCNEGQKFYGISHRKSWWQVAMLYTYFGFTNTWSKTQRFKKWIINPPNLLQTHFSMITRPVWCFKKCWKQRTDLWNCWSRKRNIRLRFIGILTSEQFDPKLDWKEIDWIRKMEKKLILKGILIVKMQ